MEKQKALVDADFFNKLAKLEKNGKTIKKILDTLDFIPVVHPYTADYELDVNDTFQRLLAEGYIQRIEYTHYLSDDIDKQYYETYFEIFHEELRKYLEKAKPWKVIEKLILPKGRSILDYHKAGMSLGDVHLILTAYFMELPVILSDDGDIGFLEERARMQFDTDDFQLTIMSIIDVFIEIAQMEQKEFSKEELVMLAKGTGHAKEKSSVKQAWNEAHSV